MQYIIGTNIFVVIGYIEGYYLGPPQINMVFMVSSLGIIL